MSEPPTGAIPIFYACVPEATEAPPIEIAWASVTFDPNGSHGVVCEILAQRRAVELLQSLKARLQGCGG